MLCTWFCTMLSIRKATRSSSSKRGARTDSESSAAMPGASSRTFFDAKDELVRGGYASETTTKIGPYDGYDYRPTDQTVQYGFSQAEAEILRYVAETYLSETAIRLCEDVVYKTPPMRDAKVGERLKMDKMKEEQDPLGFDLERLLAAEASVDAGHYRSVKDAVDELRARHRS